MTVLVTGADGFVGRWLVRALLAAGHAVVGTTLPGSRPPRISGAGEMRWVPLDLTDAMTVHKLAQEPVDAVVHLAAAASGGDALKNPGRAWEVNAAGTARLLGELGRRRACGDTDPLVLVVSTGEVYGSGSGRPFLESDPVQPRSPYAASKAGAELASRETAARTGLRVIVARAFPHTGPGQDERFVVPAFARRLALAKRLRSRVVKVGNLDVTRDILDVRDVAAAYVGLLAGGAGGETYNVASGQGITLSDLFDRIAAIVGISPIPEADPELVRPADLPYLVGDPGKLRSATGWTPRHDLDLTLRDLVDAQAV